MGMVDPARIGNQGTGLVGFQGTGDCRLTGQNYLQTAGYSLLVSWLTHSAGDQYLTIGKWSEHGLVKAMLRMMMV